MLKSCGVVVGGGLQHFSVSPSPLWFQFLLGLSWGWAQGVLGLRFWGQGLTIQNLMIFLRSFWKHLQLQLSRRSPFSKPGPKRTSLFCLELLLHSVLLFRITTTASDKNMDTVTLPTLEQTFRSPYDFQTDNIMSFPPMQYIIYYAMSTISNMSDKAFTFQISNAADCSAAAPTTKGDFGNDCSLDYIIIAEGSSTTAFGATNFNRYQIKPNNIAQGPLKIPIQLLVNSKLVNY